MIKQTIQFPSIKELLKIDVNKYPSLLQQSDEELRDVCYYKGNLRWKLDTAQQEIQNFFINNKQQIVVEAVSRQTGKSFGGLIFAFESCLKYKDYIVRYASGAESDALKIIKANLDDLIAECPETCRPKYQQKLKAWVFPNGSYLYLEGVDGAKANKRRGGKAHLIIIDEAAFISNLLTVVYQVYRPMTTTTAGRILIISTPPDSQAHEFNKLVKQAKEDGAYFELNIYDYLEKIKDDHPFFRNRILPETVEAIRKDMPPEMFAKEYLLKYESNLDHAVIPEFISSLKNAIVREFPRPRVFHPYVAMDQAGVRDLIAIVFGYYDPIDDKIIVENEIKLIAKEANTTIIGKAIVEMEKKLWADEHGEISVPIKRYSDINEQFMIRDLKTAFDLKFNIIEKTDKKQAVDRLRTLLYNETIYIHPRCKELIFHLESATWNKSGTSYERHSGVGHYDFVDAMVYFVRAINRKKIDGVKEAPNMANYMNLQKKGDTNPTTTVLKKIFKPRIRRF